MKHVIDTLLNIGIVVPDHSICFQISNEQIVFTAVHIGDSADLDIYSLELTSSEYNALLTEGVIAGNEYPLEVWGLVGFHSLDEKYRRKAVRSLKRLEAADSPEMREQILDTVTCNHDSIMFAGVFAHIPDLRDRLLQFYCQCSGLQSAMLDTSKGVWPLQVFESQAVK